MDDLFAAIEREVLGVVDSLGKYWGDDLPLAGEAWERVSVPLPHTDATALQAKWLVTLEQLSHRARAEWCGPGIPFDAVQVRLKALLSAVFSLTRCMGATREEVWFQYVQRCREVERALLEVRDLAVAARGRSGEPVNQGTQEPVATDARGSVLQAEALVSIATVPELSLRLVGEVWHLCFHAESGDYPFRGNKCLGWLAKLLSKPGHGWSVAELIGDPDGKMMADGRMRGEYEIDKESVREIKRRLEEIEELLGEGPGSERLESEKAELLERLSPYARKRRITSPIANAYNNITTQIRKIRKKLKKQMPQLEAHLKASIRSDAQDFSIRYSPPPGTPHWHVE